MNWKEKLAGNRKILLAVSLAVLLIVLLIGSIGSFQGFSERDVEFTSLDWLEENKQGTIEDIGKFCSECSAQGNCDLRLHFRVDLPTINEWNNWPFEREYHCVKIIDGVNYYDKEESYFGILGNGFDSFDYADSKQGHEVKICCGVETYDIIQKFQVLIGTFSEEGFFYQACHSKNIELKC